MLLRHTQAPDSQMPRFAIPGPKQAATLQVIFASKDPANPAQFASMEVLAAVDRTEVLSSAFA